MITPDRLREVLHYDPETGEFTWRVATAVHRKAGDKAGHVKRGYVVIQIDGQGVKYFAHRLAWLYMTGRWPTEQIDHINRNKADNRWANLREATNSQNQANSRTPSNNRSGFRGVFFCKDRRTRPWRAVIRHNGHHKHLGYFDTAAEAGSAFKVAFTEAFGRFANTQG